MKRNEHKLNVSKNFLSVSNYFLVSITSVVLEHGFSQSFLLSFKHIKWFETRKENLETRSELNTKYNISKNFLSVSNCFLMYIISVVLEHGFSQHCLLSF